ncbi:uncharacterized protein PFL1_02138 [Pseudozyma flocculosa PF-1]|uniref:uncharacterized protein n=1 Tax=Pseudozyma flocculosa PF-1 TaxID=1277687 RepID=UPI0004560A5F|nr:uncharacterized protein PFL1_02138 [Pseudozyma flocculosa PF-1]EPQ30614.1 hypothetical protein PFL1_02138 [Pseudozyma flocculosa PF-1]
MPRCRSLPMSDGVARFVAVHALAPGLRLAFKSLPMALGGSSLGVSWIVIRGHWGGRDRRHRGQGVAGLVAQRASTRSPTLPTPHSFLAPFCGTVASLHSPPSASARMALSLLAIISLFHSIFSRQSDWQAAVQLIPL